MPNSLPNQKLMSKDLIFLTRVNIFFYCSLFFFPNFILIMSKIIFIKKLQKLIRNLFHRLKKYCRLR